jgi:1-acyl-sn-glycerol-3-phosphate acyltransferase
VASQDFTRIVRSAAFFDEGHGFDLFGLHPPTLAGAVAASGPLYDRYFRVDSIGIDQLPSEGPTILISNHGGVLPIDAALLCLDVLRRSEPPRIPRAVADYFVPHLPIVGTLFARMGAVSGTRTNVRRLLERGELLVVFPEGVTGPAKRFRDRYRIQSWRVGFAELALRYGARIVPAAVIGAEESWPVLARLRRLHTFGAPYVPIPASPVPLPTHVHIRYGAPLAPSLAPDPGAADDPRAVAAVAETARTAVEQLIADARRARRGVFR